MFSLKPKEGASTPAPPPQNTNLLKGGIGLSLLLIVALGYNSYSTRTSLEDRINNLEKQLADALDNMEKQIMLQMRSEISEQAANQPKPRDGRASAGGDKLDQILQRLERLEKRLDRLEGSNPERGRR